MCMNRIKHRQASGLVSCAWRLFGLRAEILRCARSVHSGQLKQVALDDKHQAFLPHAVIPRAARNLVVVRNWDLVVGLWPPLGVQFFSLSAIQPLSFQPQYLLPSFGRRIGWLDVEEKPGQGGSQHRPPSGEPVLTGAKAGYPTGPTGRRFDRAGGAGRVLQQLFRAVFFR